MRTSILPLLLGLLGAAGCNTSTAPSLEVIQRLPPTNELALGPGDRFEIRVVGEPDMSKEFQLGSDGTIDFPYIHQIKLEGLDAHEAASTIARTLVEQKYIRNPQVSILIKDQSSKKIIVIGQVSKGGTFSFKPNMNILDAISDAGGFTAIASKNRVTITRIENGQKFSLEVPVGDISEGKAKNIPLRPGDIILVPERIL